MENKFNVFASLELGRLMIEPYTSIQKNEDVVEIFTKITGCVGSGEYPDRNWPSTSDPRSCSPEVQMALNFTVQLDSGRGCLQSRLSSLVKAMLSRL